MSHNIYDLKTLPHRIKTMLDEGKSHREIYKELSDVPEGEMLKPYLARKIAATASEAARQQHRMLHRILMGLMLLALVIILIFMVRAVITAPFDRAFLLTTTLAFVYELFLLDALRTYKGNHLYSLMIYAPFKVYFLFQIIQDPFFQYWAIALVAITLASMVVAFVFRQRAFPYLLYGGPRKGADGELF